MITSWCTNSQSSFWSPGPHRKGRGAEETSSRQTSRLLLSNISDSTCVALSACADLISSPGPLVPLAHQPHLGAQARAVLSLPWHFRGRLLFIIQISVPTSHSLRSLPWPTHIRANPNLKDKVCRGNRGSLPTQVLSLPLPYFFLQLLLTAT